MKKQLLALAFLMPFCSVQAADYYYRVKVDGNWYQNPTYRGERDLGFLYGDKVTNQSGYVTVKLDDNNFLELGNDGPSKGKHGLYVYVRDKDGNKVHETQHNPGWEGVFVRGPNENVDPVIWTINLTRKPGTPNYMIDTKKGMLDSDNKQKKGVSW